VNQPRQFCPDAATVSPSPRAGTTQLKSAGARASARFSVREPGGVEVV
jgi:hypothetical protein